MYRAHQFLALIAISISVCCIMQSFNCLWRCINYFDFFFPVITEPEVPYEVHVSASTRVGPGPAISSVFFTREGGT